MRGNETAVLIILDRVDLEFPIPMRGNEVERLQYYGGTAQFPIPMRGNEAS